MPNADQPGQPPPMSQEALILLDQIRQMSDQPVSNVEQLAAAEAQCQAAHQETGTIGQQEILGPTPGRNGKYGRPRRVLKTIFSNPPMQVFAESPSNLAYGEIRLRPGHVKMSLDTWQTVHADQQAYATLQREVEQYRGGATVRAQIIDAGDYGRQRQAELDRLRASLQLPPGDLEDLRAQVDNLIIQLGNAADAMTERQVATFTERWLAASNRLDAITEQLDELRGHLTLAARKLGPGA